MKCDECSKRLSIFHAYYHPSLRKNHIVCSNCCDKISESLKKWIDFILPYAGFFQKSTKNENLNSNWKKIFFGFIKSQKEFTNILFGNKIDILR